MQRTSGTQLYNIPDSTHVAALPPGWTGRNEYTVRLGTRRSKSEKHYRHDRSPFNSTMYIPAECISICALTDSL